MIAAPLFNRLALIGTGLIGSSIARAARAQGTARAIVATARSAATRRRVTELGIADQVAETNAACEVSPVVVRVAADVMVPGDRPRLERVVQNIVENAMKYSQDAVPVHVEVGQQDPWAVLTVRDHGVGIPTDELAHIFTPFYRASTAKGITGTGLGLAGTKSVVTQHGGQISLESAVGWGTSVTVCLPLCGR